MPCSRRILLAAIASAVLAAPGRIARADPVLLTVTGRITEHGNPGRVELDHDALVAIGLETLITRTPWTEGEQEFTGVPAHALLEAVGATGSELQAFALNDYEVTIPLAELERYPVLIAMYRNGKRLSLRDMGPLWIVYPWSEFPELDNALTRRRSIWQLARLHVQ